MKLLLLEENKSDEAFIPSGQVGQGGEPVVNEQRKNKLTILLISDNMQSEEVILYLAM